ncbi:MAG: hypothetical protein AB1571_03500 [Nanoarchaeota archaeon]
MDKKGNINPKSGLRAFGFFIIAIGAIVAGVFKLIPLGTILIGIGTAITGVSEFL